MRPEIGDHLTSVDAPTVGTKVHTTITAALVDVTDGEDFAFEVGNTTVLDAECTPDAWISLVLQIMAGGCELNGSATFSFNAKVVRGRIYRVQLDTTCSLFNGGPYSTLVAGCKVAPPDGTELPSLVAPLGPAPAYAQTVTSIAARRGGVRFGYHAVTLGNDVPEPIVSAVSDSRETTVARIDNAKADTLQSVNAATTTIVEAIVAGCVSIHRSWCDASTLDPLHAAGSGN